MKMKRWHAIIILAILTLITASYLPYSQMRETKHKPLSEAEDLLSKPFPDNDGDLLSDLIEESIAGTNISRPDTDGDLFPDGAEYDFWNSTMRETGLPELGPTGDADGDGTTNILDWDSDGDEVPDGWEVANDLLPWSADTDGDGGSDRLEYYIQYDYDAFPDPTDEDGDRIPDRWERHFGVGEPDDDLDEDGVTNLYEWIQGSDPTWRDERYGFEYAEWEYDREWKLEHDTDFDGLSNKLENAMGLDPENYDSDEDGISDGEEVLEGTLPFDDDTDGDGLKDNVENWWSGSSPFTGDTDMDGLPDQLEVITFPDVPDTDRDLIPDGSEPHAFDPDRDGLPTAVELDDGDGETTDPTDPDSDGDGIWDGTEDRNRNGRRDGDELRNGESDWGHGGETDPLKYDTDQGGTGDGEEMMFGFDPLDPSDDPDLDIDPPDWDLPVTPTVNLLGLLFSTPVLIIVAIVFLAVLLALLLFRTGAKRKERLVEDVIRMLGSAERVLYELDDSDEIRNLIYRIYVKFQRMLGGQGLFRASSMTVREFETMVARELPVKKGPISRITGIFEEARYSDHALGVPTRNRAVRVFREFRLDLEEYVRDRRGLIGGLAAFFCIRREMKGIDGGRRGGKQSESTGKLDERRVVDKGRSRDGGRDIGEHGQEAVREMKGGRD